jgi:hypothetical protein
VEKMDEVMWELKKRDGECRLCNNSKNNYNLIKAINHATNKLADIGRNIERLKQEEWCICESCSVLNDLKNEIALINKQIEDLENGKNG